MLLLYTLLVNNKQNIMKQNNNNLTNGVSEFIKRNPSYNVLTLNNMKYLLYLPFFLCEFKLKFSFRCFFSLKVKKAKQVKQKKKKNNHMVV